MNRASENAEERYNIKKITMECNLFPMFTSEDQMNETMSPEPLSCSRKAFHSLHGQTNSKNPA
jgi:hypothetical protein